MPIRNKDGTHYKLRGPNPLMNHQERWNAEEFVLHNMSWEPVDLPGEATPPRPHFVPNPELPPPAEVTQFPEPEPAPEPEPPAPEPVPEPIPEPPKSIPPPAPQPRPETTKKEMFAVECMPARIRRFKDELYGTTMSTIQYGFRTTFDAGQIASNDIELVLWTTRDDIDEGSILFPRDGRRRWWRVTSSEPHGAGHALHCVASDEQPSFD